MKIDPFTPLPEGLSFDGGKITGVCTEPVNKFIHVLINNNAAAISFELRIYARGNDAELEDMPKEAKKKKGCFGEVASVVSLTALLGAVGIGLILTLNKKRRVAE